MATIKQKVKKTKSKGVIQLKEGQYFTVKTPDSGYISMDTNYSNEDNCFNLPLDYNCDESIDIDINEEGQINISDIENEGFSEFRIVTRSESIKLNKKYDLQNIKASGYTGRPYLVSGKPGFSFGCGDFKAPTEDITNWLKWKNLISKDNSYQRYKEFDQEIEDFGSIPSKQEVKNLIKHFKIK